MQPVVHYSIEMPRFGRSLSPINSVKHIVDTEGTLLPSANSLVPLATAVLNTGATFVVGDVRVGGKVNGIFLSVFAIGETGAPVSGAVNWYIAKIHSGQTSPQPGITGTSELRNQIIHEEKGLVGSGDGTAMAFKGVIVIPRGMRRMREGDRIVWVGRMTGTDNAQFCLKAIYKSFF